MAHGKANALDTEFCDALTGQFDELRKRRSRAPSSSPGRAASSRPASTCSRSSKAAPDYLREFLPALNKMYDAVFFHPKPVVAAINGHAIAGGCVLACCADYRLMARGTAASGVTELLVGLPFPALAFEVMRFVTPPQFFPDVIFSGATFPPERTRSSAACSTRSSSRTRCMERALEAGETLAALSPQAFALTKQQMRLVVTDRIKRDGTRIDAAVDEDLGTHEREPRLRPRLCGADVEEVA